MFLYYVRFFIIVWPFVLTQNIAFIIYPLTMIALLYYYVIYFSVVLVGNFVEFCKFTLATGSVYFSFFCHFKILLRIRLKKKLCQNDGGKRRPCL